MKTYQGMSATETNRARVFARDSHGRILDFVHHVRYNQDGFGWGDSGIASAELSRCILLDAFGITSCPYDTCSCENEWADSFCEQFKEEFIAKLDPKSGWKITQAEIMDWVFDATAHERIALVPDPV